MRMKSLNHETRGRQTFKKKVYKYTGRGSEESLKMSLLWNYVFG